MKKDEQTNINSEMIDKISILAQLSLTEEEKLLAGDDMVRMLDFFALLSAWDEGSEGVEGPARSDRFEEMEGPADGSENPVGAAEIKGTEGTPAASRNILRRDEVTNKEDDGKLMANAPLQKDGMFVVPLSIAAGTGEETSDGQD